ncbi:hypothetical protein Fmac_018181 [Flemingia macrophylla]|uniref:Uncharacterized protein n=1 Tax=Flemingia macrophylla TaxID=520843 RepID=A0ABD1M486_9FABA
MPTKITLLSLIISSEPHRKALLKVLNEAYVSHSISQDNFKGIVSHITANDYLSFTDEEIPPEGPNHNKPLHISVKCKEYLIAKVLVDNGSSLNVMPKRTLKQEGRYPDIKASYNHQMPFTFSRDMFDLMTVRDHSLGQARPPSIRTNIPRPSSKSDIEQINGQKHTRIHHLQQATLNTRSSAFNGEPTKS